MILKQTLISEKNDCILNIFMEQIVADADISVKFNIVGCCGAEFREKFYAANYFPNLQGA